MTPAEYRDVLKRLSMTQERAALMAGYHPRTGQRWCDPEGSGPPKTIELLVQHLERVRQLEIHVADLVELVEQSRDVIMKGSAYGLVNEDDKTDFEWKRLNVLKSVGAKA